METVRYRRLSRPKSERAVPECGTTVVAIGIGATIGVFVPVEVFGQVRAEIDGVGHSVMIAVCRSVDVGTCGEQKDETQPHT